MEESEVSTMEESEISTVEESETSESDYKERKPFKCAFKGCKAAFSKSSKLTIHIRKHNNERPFQCEEPNCQKTYTNSSHLRRHKSVTHGDKKDQAVCCGYEGCGLVLANKYTLKKHYNYKHNPSRGHPFTCGICSEGFKRKWRLQQHLYVHTGVAPFQCDKCTMCFTTLSTFQKHKKSHKMYTCKCGEVFHRWSEIIFHRKSCSKWSKLRYECNVCSKVFNHMGNFKDHQQAHKDVADKDLFFCEYPNCNRYYSYARNLSQHVATFHEKVNADQQLPCPRAHCDLVLKTNQSLKQHLRRHDRWIRKKARKERCDKGKKKVSIAAVLAGVQASASINQTLVSGVDISSLNISLSHSGVIEEVSA